MWDMLSSQSRERGPDNSGDVKLHLRQSVGISAQAEDTEYQDYSAVSVRGAHGVTDPVTNNCMPESMQLWDLSACGHAQAERIPIRDSRGKDSSPTSRPRELQTLLHTIVI